MRLFLGEFGHTLDEKGRLTLPKKIREELTDDYVILSRGYDTCIFGFDRKRWEEEAEKNLSASITDAHGRSLRRYLFSSAEKVDLDRLGRLLLPARLKEYSTITQNVSVIGAGDHFELWDPKLWVSYTATMEGQHV
jgi:MraZ protein